MSPPKPLIAIMYADPMRNCVMIKCFIASVHRNNTSRNYTLSSADCDIYTWTQRVYEYNLISYRIRKSGPDVATATADMLRSLIEIIALGIQNEFI